MIASHPFHPEVKHNRSMPGTGGNSCANCAFLIEAHECSYSKLAGSNNPATPDWTWRRGTSGWGSRASPRGRWSRARGIFLPPLLQFMMRTPARSSITCPQPRIIGGERGCGSRGVHPRGERRGWCRAARVSGRIDFENEAFLRTHHPSLSCAETVVLYREDNKRSVWFCENLIQEPVHTQAGGMKIYVVRPAWLISTIIDLALDRIFSMALLTLAECCPPSTLPRSQGCSLEPLKTRSCR